MANCTEVGASYIQEPVSSVSVIIPALNEEGAVESTIQEIDAALSETDYDYEIILVDDGSTDNTREIAIKAGARVIVHNANMGYGNSLMDGIRAAKFPVIAITDADGTYPISMLPGMLEKANTFDMVIGRRMWTKDNTSLLGRIFRKGLFHLIKFLTSARAEDYNSGFRVFRKMDIMDYHHALCPTFSFTTTLTLIYLLARHSISFVDIEYSKRIGFSKVSYLGDAITTLKYVFMIANLFQVYRATLLIIALLILINAVFWFVGWLLDFALGTQVAILLTTCTAFIMGGLSMNTAPINQLYVRALHEKRN